MRGSVWKRHIFTAEDQLKMNLFLLVFKTDCLLFHLLLLRGSAAAAAALLAICSLIETSLSSKERRTTVRCQKKID